MTGKITKLFFLILIPAFLLSTCVEEYEEDAGSVFRYNEPLGILSLDPAYARDKTMIWPDNQIYNGLVQLDENLNVLPCIASSWDISEDGRVYNFYLRSDVYFHPHRIFTGGRGRKLTADDFVFSFSRILDPAIASPGAWIFNNLDRTEEYPGFHAVNDTVFQIRLKEAFPPFTGILTMPYCFAVPREAGEAEDFDPAVDPVGTGPFRFGLWKRDEKLILIRNENYFETDSEGNSLPYLDAVSISFIKDRQSEFLEFLLGNLDFLSGLHAVYKDELTTLSGNLNPEYKDRFVMQTRPYLNTEYLGILSETSSPEMMEHPLGNKYFRKALSYGFHREKMLKFLRNNMGYPALYGFLPSGLPYHNQSTISGYSYNPDSVRFYLDKAGYSARKEIPEIQLTTTSAYLDICEFIQYELSVFDISISIDIATGGAYRNKLANGHLKFFRGSWIADYPDPENYLSLFYSRNRSPLGPNYTRFSNPVYDSLYEKSLKTTGVAERERIYTEMDNFLMENAVVIPLFYDKVVRFFPPEIKNFQANPLNLLILKEVKKQ